MARMDGAYYGGGYGGGYGAYGGPYGWSIGGVRLKVEPKDAEVYVDGYYAGVVDDFDGMWQQLRLDDGGHASKIRKPGMDDADLRRDDPARSHDHLPRRHAGHAL